MKKKYIICIASVLFALIVCIWISYRHSKQYVFTYVQNHTDELTEYAEEIIETAPNHTLSYEGWDAEFYESTDMVQFFRKEFYESTDMVQFFRKVSDSEREKEQP